MVEVTEALILKLETLARLELTESERHEIKQDLEAILEMVEKLEEVETDGIEPLTHLNSGPQVLRSDMVGNQLTEEEALRNAPDKQPPYFRVPKVISRS
jgi:aspartyl-tRNA(Asn)/glutamyl-tRNA(Gln) amidotransferase subunit C